VRTSGGVPVVDGSDPSLDFGGGRGRALTPAEFARDVAACSPSTVSKMIANGQLHAVRIGDRGWRIPPAVVAAFQAGDVAGFSPRPAPGECCPACGQQVWREVG
jgi:excisionase family DNA binding protein